MKMRSLLPRSPLASRLCAVQDDVVRFFEGFELENGASSVHLLLRDDGRVNGDAIVFMKSEEEAKRAELDRNNKEIGGRWLVVRQETLKMAKDKLARQVCVC